MATDELAMRGATVSVTMELAKFSWKILIPATEAFFKDIVFTYSVYTCAVQCTRNLHLDWYLTFTVFMATKNKYNLMSYELVIWYQHYSHKINVQRLRHILSTINTCSTLRYFQVNDYNLYYQFPMFVYHLHDNKLWNTARRQETAFDTASDSRVNNLWSSCGTLQHWAQGNINSLMVKYKQVWNRILSQDV